MQFMKITYPLFITLSISLILTTSSTKPNVLIYTYHRIGSFTFRFDSIEYIKVLDLTNDQGVEYSCIESLDIEYTFQSEEAPRLRTGNNLLSITKKSWDRRKNIIYGELQ